MDRKIITVSKKIMRTVLVDWDIDWRNQSSGPATNGSVQVVASGFPRWVGTPTLLLFGDFIGQFRALRDAAQGRMNVFRIPMIDPTGYDLGEVAPRTVPFDGGTTLSNNLGFDFDPIVIATDGASAGDTELRLNDSNAQVKIKVGQILSYNDWPFRIVSKIKHPSSGWTCQVAPAIRSNIPDGALVQAIGTGLFQLADQSSGRVSYGLERIAQPSMDLQEWINR